MKPWARWFYKSKVWERTREAYIAYRHGLCERCGVGGKVVHHKIKLTPQNINDPNVTLNWDNIDQEGVLEVFEQGSQRFLREHPATKVYNTMIQRYATRLDS